MQKDDTSYYLIYRVLGISNEEGKLIDEYQNKRIQQTLETLYKGVDGEYYYGDGAWKYIQKYTDVDLLNILETIAEGRK